MDTLKVLVISAAFPPMKVGEADHAFHLCRRLAERGLDVHVLTTKGNGIGSGAPFRIYPTMPHWLWSSLPRLMAFIKRCAPSAILLIFTDRDYDYHPMILCAPFLSKRLVPGASFVSQLETQFLCRRVSILTQAAFKLAARCFGPKYFDYAYGTLVGHSDRVIVLSEDHRGQFADTFSRIESKLVVIPPAPLLRVIEDDDGSLRRRGRQSLGVKPQEFLLAYFGYIYPDKGLETLLEALSVLRQRRPDARLVIIGGGLGASHDPSYLAKLHKLADEVGVKSQVAWTGEYDSNSDRPSAYLHAADACVLPFDHGVTLNRSSVAAAAAHGLPIVTTKGDRIESAFQDGQNVLLCPARNPRQLAYTLERLMSHSDQRDRLRRGALQLAREFFNWDMTVSRTVEALRG